VDQVLTRVASAVPNYNPREVVQNLLRLIDGQEMTTMDPWYKAFNGEITLKKKDKYQVRLLARCCCNAPSCTLPS
jgi:DNA topoisomerase-2